MRRFAVSLKALLNFWMLSKKSFWANEIQLLSPIRCELHPRDSGELIEVICFFYLARQLSDCYFPLQPSLGPATASSAGPREHRMGIAKNLFTRSI